MKGLKIDGNGRVNVITHLSGLKELFPENQYSAKKISSYVFAYLYFHVLFYI